MRGEYRVMRNKSPIGKRWKLVVGFWNWSYMRVETGTRRWETDFVVSFHDSQVQAEREMRERMKKPY